MKKMKTFLTYNKYVLCLPMFLIKMNNFQDNGNNVQKLIKTEKLRP